MWTAKRAFTLVSRVQPLLCYRNFPKSVILRYKQASAIMSGEVTKKFFNTTEKIVDDSIKGLAAIHPVLLVHPQCSRVVLRSDIAKNEHDKVSLIAGGGSGHEPFAAGFVGKGFLTAAVCGDVFTSPPSAHITTALEAVSNKKGTVVFVINYTGDRLNFGLAVERFNQTQTSKCPALMVVIGDDTALEARGQGTVGRRGLAGSIMIMKMAGAMAEKGLPSDQVAAMAQRANECVGTLGISLSACSIPGKGPMFSLKSNEMELGLGIHGEPGCERTSFAHAKEVVNLLLTRLERSEKKCLSRGSKLVILLNNLGGTSQIEMNVMAGEIRSWLHTNGYSVARFYSGTLMTSLDGHGISLTVLRVDDDAWLEYLDAPTNAPAWSFREGDISTPVNVWHEFVKEREEQKETDTGLTLTQDEAQIFSQCLKNACSSILASEERLDQLDSQSGDGDCGHTLALGATQVLCSLKDGKILCTRPQTAFKQISVIFEKAVGGTAGALYALMFNAASEGFVGTTVPAAWHVALTRGLEAVMRYGEARPGYRSMVDPLHAAASAIKTSIYTKNEWENLVKAAEQAAEATATMKAQCGRASYTAEATQTRPDPGAIAVAIWLRAIYDAAFS